MILSGAEVSAAINYWTLRPHNPELAEAVKKSRLQKINNYALPSFIFSIILFIIALPLSMKEQIDVQFRLFIVIRYAFFTLNCTIWYFLRDRVQRHINIFVLYMYASFALLSIVFAELVTGPYAA